MIAEAAVRHVWLVKHVEQSRPLGRWWTLALTSDRLENQRIESAIAKLVYDVKGRAKLHRHPSFSLF